jgi:hypothetical protein
VLVWMAESAFGGAVSPGGELGGIRGRQTSIAQGLGRLGWVATAFCLAVNAGEALGARVELSSLQVVETSSSPVILPPPPSSCGLYGFGDR